MKNVILVSTKHTKGRAWAIWSVKEENIDNIDFIVSDNEGERKAFHIMDYMRVIDIETMTPKYVFKLTDVQEHEGSKDILDSVSHLVCNSGVVYGEYDEDDYFEYDDEDEDEDDGYDPFTDYDDDPFIQQAHNTWLQDKIDRG